MELRVNIIVDRLKTHVTSDVGRRLVRNVVTFYQLHGILSKEYYLVRTLLMTVQVPEAGVIIGQSNVIGQAMEVSFCLCRTANHQRCHIVAFHTSVPNPRGQKQE